MDLSNLSAAFEAHKAPILAAAAAGTAGLAYYRKKHPTAPAGPAQGVSTASAGGQTAGMNGAAAYDSSASDVYGLVQPQLESLGGQLTDLANRFNAYPIGGAPAASTTPTGSTVNGGAGAGGTPPTPVPAATATPSWQTIYSSPSATTDYLTSQMNAAGGSATYTAQQTGPYVGRIDSTAVPISQQTYEPIAVGLNGQQAWLSQQALPQTGSKGPVGTVYTEDGHTKKVTGYTFNGMPNVSWLS